jgi:hypothetical protein
MCERQVSIPADPLAPGARALSFDDLALQASVDRARRFLVGQAATRTVYNSSSLVPDDAAVDRTSSGSWEGTYTLPTGRHSLPYTPILIRGPLHFPIVSGRPATFQGTVDLPFISLEGPAGVRAVDGSWGSFFVVGSVDGMKQFIARVIGNATFEGSVVSSPKGSWSFQLISYANAADAMADVNRIAIGHPWLEAERPGDVRQYYAVDHTPRAPVFSDVVLRSVDGNATITGTLGAFTADRSFAYRILVTSESDVEYAWALEDAAPGAFSITKPRAFGGKIKLRLVELDNGRGRRVVGQVWAEENAADRSAWPDLRIEYRSMAANIPPSPTSTVPARLDGTWSVTLVPPGTGRVSLVDVDTKRVYGEYTMPSGLLRSFNVPAADAGQTTAEIYYDAFNDTCFLYDQAVALIAFLQLGERDAARRLVDALLAVQNPDGSFPFANHQGIPFEHNAGFIRIGAVAWVCYALLLADQPEFRDWFAPGTAHAVRRCLDFLLTHRNALGLLNGGKGRYVGTALHPDFVVPWWSTEHNIDTWWCFQLAADLYGDARYRAIAEGIRAALETAGWNEAKGIFWQGGTTTKEHNVPDGQHALDVMSWGGIVLGKWGRPAVTAAAIARMFRLYYVTDEPTGLSGFTTFVPADGYPLGTVLTPWYEGSFGAVAAIRTLDPARANDLMARLVKAQNADGSYPYALRADPINEIHTFPSLIGAAWNVLAYAGLGSPHRQVLWT